ncbi:RNA pseudouridine synthase [Colwellia sp. D2M02]|uniref:pseudouridine synthase n=1 Tax=Colwellia sp. D2M02 TaxID=2841562 RepID=UPI001C0A2784|nr:pseudouridine synthase [Colwellia sp. D2M02]MBU2892924.1 RNA pseudouridine synthase [Colwellia sp. D2M02]
MQPQDHCFTPFTQSVDEYTLPERFTFPFYYQPHPLCLVACEQLQQHIQNQTDWQHSFKQSGKMFGVLLVKSPQGELGYLSAFSGKLADSSVLPGFVPPVFDSAATWDAELEFSVPEGESHFLREQEVINRLNDEITTLAANPNIAKYQSTLAENYQAEEQEVGELQQLMTQQRKIRKTQRKSAQVALANNEITATELARLQDKLAKESVDYKNQLKYLKLAWQQKNSTLQNELNALLNAISSRKSKRKMLSAALQQQLFQQYRFLNIAGIEKNLIDIFENTAFHDKYGVPPAGSGDCAAPKLLQYAFKQGMKPLAMAEFWWGESPKSEMKQHKNFYTACIGKCQPILTHMLSGMDVDENPLLNNVGEDKVVDIVYQDETMAIINKPSEFLSVPGKTIQDSVFHRMQALFPSATGPLIVHRLDMSTSGLMVIALTKDAHKNLQQQFIKRTVEKRYVALLEGGFAELELKQAKVGGIITLPLAGDFDDRPKQIVCFDNGKNAETTWHLATEQAEYTRVYLHPKTGRTHQLRVHCAHKLGLNMPILGDDLYGHKASRLHLHADTLILNHPKTDVRLTFQVNAEF